MGNRESYLGYVSSENYKNQLDVWYKAYNISREKTELFHDFLFSLHELVDDTFLGVDVLWEQEKQISHFTWCWDKVIENFSKEKIPFKERGIHYEYFWNFYMEAYYYNHMVNEPIRIREYFMKLFDFKYQKSRSELDVFIEVYKLLEQNLKK
jgi:hypothetical protein